MKLTPIAATLNIAFHNQGGADAIQTLRGALQRRAFAGSPAAANPHVSELSTDDAPAADSANGQ